MKAEKEPLSASAATPSPKFHPSSLILQPSDHRPWPVPSNRWIMRQIWLDLLFAHWPIDPAIMRALVPAGLDLDIYDGQAWVGVVPFHMADVGLRTFPGVPTVTNFPELNVRTYVTFKGQKAGVYFFSLDAASPLAVAVARRWYHLPYFNAKMAAEIQGDTVTYNSQRTHRGAPPANFAATYGPTGDIYHSKSGTLEQWLTERYCLYAVDRRQRIYRGEINHAPWPLQPAQADISLNTMAQAHNIPLPDLPPLLHFAKRLDVVAWSIKPVK